MKRLLLLSFTAVVIVLALAPAVRAQVWTPGEAPKESPKPAPAPPPAPTPPPPSPDTPKAKQDDQQIVEIQDFEFSPAELTVEAGTTVTWQNQGNAPHTVTADDGLFDSGRLQPGQSFSHTFESAGTIAYHCDIHREMTASVTVSGGGATQKDKATTPPPKKVEEAPAKQASAGGGWLTTALIVAVVVLAGALVFVILRSRAS